MTALYDIIGYPFGYLMSWIYSFVGNYGVAIILFTLLTKILFFPVNYRTQMNSARMRLMQPKLDKLKKSEIEPNLALIRETLDLPEDVVLIPFSAEKGQGRELLLAEINKLI